MISVVAQFATGALSGVCVAKRCVGEAEVGAGGAGAVAQRATDAADDPGHVCRQDIGALFNQFHR